ncbi:hypothetical protein GOP47_0009422 [Adiantum capillus-veneris]|uniref:Uncharacterized protein n=1 Tax=Adiantum capillus-veneris TaxID=13818 RepID=A0A9D4UWN1_ADICA|nr:hypothetical protein GOP47_0009422 [Adiantum capillus-veneris]
MAELERVATAHPGEEYGEGMEEGVGGEGGVVGGRGGGSGGGCDSSGIAAHAAARRASAAGDGLPHRHHLRPRLRRRHPLFSLSLSQSIKGISTPRVHRHILSCVSTDDDSKSRLIGDITTRFHRCK